jgi:hypothetical protein
VDLLGCARTHHALLRSDPVSLLAPGEFHYIIFLLKNTVQLPLRPQQLFADFLVLLFLLLV